MVQTYVSLDLRDHLAAFTDAFSRVWDFNLAWVFPPPPLLPQVLHHLNLCPPESRFLIVAPRWEKVFWRADLKSRAIAPPLLISDVRFHLVDLATHESTSSCRRPDVGNLADTGWASHISGWSIQESSLLTAAWRPSTRSTYRKPWSRWVSWASSNNLDPLSPRPCDLAKFLAHLFHVERLSFKSILLHKSVVSTMSNPDNSHAISSHPIVSRMIKGISALQPPKTIRAIWNVSDLRSWMLSNLPASSSYFEVARHLALLLLLLSGRRIHDLTLLRIGPLHSQRSSEFIVFWPSFGSKSDSSSFQQSGWQFSSISASIPWNVAHWTEVFLDLRQARCDLWSWTPSSSLLVEKYVRLPGLS